jgi:hypothetical protein
MSARRGDRTGLRRRVGSLWPDDWRMRPLQDVTIQRAGITARHWHEESELCRAEADGGSLALRFDIASKGGGRTDILLTVGASGVRDLLAMIANDGHVGLQLLREALAHETQTDMQRVVDSVSRSADDLLRVAEAADAFTLRQHENEIDERAHELVAELRALSSSMSRIHSGVQSLLGPATPTTSD